MRILVVFCHPSAESYCAALLDAARRGLLAAGHDLRVRDLYREGFDPVLSEEEWTSYLVQPDENARRHAEHVADLRWAEGLIVIYPTWYFGPPAMLKGWLEKVWLPGVSFEIAPGRFRRARPLLCNIRLFVGITTSGSPWWWMRLIRDPGRSLWIRALRPMFAPRCRLIWRQLHDMNHRSQADREAFLEGVERDLGRV